jgi:hypothetical protein
MGLTGNTITEEKIQQNIIAAFDSVNLITNNVIKEKDDKTIQIVQSNYQHLEIMFMKDWFFDGLSEAQKTTIRECISSGITYCN